MSEYIICKLLFQVIISTLEEAWNTQPTSWHVQNLLKTLKLNLLRTE